MRTGPDRVTRLRSGAPRRWPAPMAEEFADLLARSAVYMLSMLGLLAILGLVAVDR